MAYQKFFVDNTTCSRRFHLTYDTDGKPVERVHIECPHCGVTVFSAKDHPAVKFAREENLVKTTALADLTISECQFRDVLSEKTIPKSKLKHSGPIYQTPPKG